MSPSSPSSPVLMATSSILATLLAGLTGYYIGKSAGLRKRDQISTLQKKSSASPSGAIDNANEFAPDPSASTSDNDWEEATSSTLLINEDCKLVLVVRTDLQMTKGKIAAQCGHAALMCYKSALKHTPQHVKRWETYGQTKIAVRCDGGEEELLTLQAVAQSLGVTAKVVQDAGRTQVEAGSRTVLGVGPAPKSLVDQVTGGLKLL